MTAKEMFEELGYFYDRKATQIIIFSTWVNGFDEIKLEEIMRFVKYDKNKIFKNKGLKLDFKKEFDIKLFKAINKQIEELGFEII